MVDLNDIHQSEGVEAVKEQINKAEMVSGKQVDSAAEIARLAQLPLVKYAQERKHAAKSLGIRIDMLDKIIGDERKKNSNELPSQGGDLTLPEPDLWPESVDGVRLVYDLVAAILTYVVMGEGQAIAIALWVIHCHVFDIFYITPRLTISSPEKGCGKTTLLDVIWCLVPRPLLTANVTAAVVYRVIQKWRPTLLIDEADASFKDKEELRGILNSGHTERGNAIRLVGDDHDAKVFATHCPVAIALIGNLADTLQDRSVVIGMRRRRPSETAIRFRPDRTDDLTRLASMSARWAADNRDLLKLTDPIIPEALYNRVADNWRPLLTIADVIGGIWSERAREVAIELSTDIDTHSASHRTQLLSDIRQIFDDLGTDKISSLIMVTELTKMEGRPWAEWSRGRPLSQNGLARLLAPFDIVPGTIRIDNHDTPKGYKQDQFIDAWDRYLTPMQPHSSATTPQDGSKCGSVADRTVVNDDDDIPPDQSMTEEEYRKNSQSSLVYMQEVLKILPLP